MAARNISLPLFCLLAVVALLSQPQTVNAGGALCAACIPTCLAMPPSCWGCILALCPGSCFQENTVVTRLRINSTADEYESSSALISNSFAERVPVSAIRAGDMLLSLDPVTKALSATAVKFNRRVEQRKAFTELRLESGKKLQVTSDHGVVVLRGGKDLLVPAPNVVVGDAMYVADGNTEYVIGTEDLELDTRFTLQTADGTVLAGDVFVGTLCGSELSHQLLPKLASWHESHSDPDLLLTRK